MKRLTERFMYGLGHKDCYDACSVCDVAVCCGLLEDILEKLAHYEDLEEQLEKLYGGKMPLDEVVENLNRIVQNGEEKLDYARILTNAEAEKWDKWKDLEEQGRLIELPCKVGDKVYSVHSAGLSHAVIAEVDTDAFFLMLCVAEGRIGKTVFTTKEAAEAKLAEMEGAE